MKNKIVPAGRGTKGVEEEEGTPLPALQYASVSRGLINYLQQYIIVVDY